MDKRGDATVLQTMNMFQVIGGLFFVVVMIFALNQVTGAGSKSYALEIDQQLKLGKTLVGHANSDSSIVYLAGRGVKLEDSGIDKERTSLEIIKNFGSRRIVIEKRNEKFRIYEE